MTKLEVVELLLAFGPGILAFVVYGWFLWLFLFRKPDIRTLGIRIRRRLFLAAAFWPLFAFIPGMIVALFLCHGDLFPFALSFLVSYAAGLFLLMPWYPRLPFLGRRQRTTDFAADVSLVRRALSYASFVALFAWFLFGLGISGGRLGEHCLERGARSIEKQFGNWVSVSSFPDRGGGYYEYPKYPTHSFCPLCWAEQHLRHTERRREWRVVSRNIQDSIIGPVHDRVRDDCGEDIAGGE